MRRRAGGWFLPSRVSPSPHFGCATSSPPFASSSSSPAGLSGGSRTSENRREKKLPQRRRRLRPESGHRRRRSIPLPSFFDVVVVVGACGIPSPSPAPLLQPPPRLPVIRSTSSSAGRPACSTSRRGESVVRCLFRCRGLVLARGARPLPPPRGVGPWCA
ncbi:unnamed protein product [Ixodes persulcatus]